MMEWQDRLATAALVLFVVALVKYLNLVPLLIGAFMAFFVGEAHM